jgi:hypothetical protein
MVAFLWRHRRQLHTSRDLGSPRSDASHDAVSAAADVRGALNCGSSDADDADAGLIVLSDFDQRWGAFYLQYTVRAWYRQPLLLLRRFAFAAASVLLRSATDRFTSFGALNFTALLLHLYSRPFDSTQLNRIETGAYILLIYISFILVDVFPPDSILTQVARFILVVPPAAVMLLWTVKQHLSAPRCRWHRGQRDASEDDSMVLNDVDRFRIFPHASHRSQDELRDMLVSDAEHESASSSGQYSSFDSQQVDSGRVASPILNDA